MKSIFLLALVSVISVSCSSAKPGDSVLNQEVPYKVAKNYFVKNNIDAAIDNPKFENQQDFDQVFGMATTMGESGKPTAIDFSKEFAVAQIEDPSTQKVELKPISIRKNANILEIKYRKIVGENQSYTSQPVMILIIDNKYNGDVNFVEVK
ncbi:hypothetical protein LUD75_14660 [Epilithonimonas sp. JDS]|uniref:hypothetical protein n=1 Tax=Epilithonimonas sp. JDS TaxID=2902797 RepID=UPI001E4ED210|nr:hypothetical protein [Epilithonimonas sp. JDS]MCD9855965.1 hypothetical protein [Epilithonimonas sp. JDS]